MKKRHHHPPRHPVNQPVSASPPTPVDALVQQACAHHNAGRLSDAEALYRQVLELSPDHPTALQLISLLASQVGQNTIALDLIDRAIRVNPSDAVSHFTRGNILFVLGRHQDSLESYSQTVRLDPQHAEARNNRGSALHALKQYSAALADYDHAIRLKPDYADAHANRANTLYKLQQYQAAVEGFDHAIALNPNSPEALNNRGNALHALEQHQAAVESYNRAIALNPNYADAYANRGNALQALNFGNTNISKADSGGRDLVFYCGRSQEIWNPEIVSAQGIGGSEEAVIWLSRLLHRRGWNVTVYAACGEQEKIYDGVTWKPYWMWNYRDKQNITILWRYPHLAEYEINSDKVILDLHDVLPNAEFSPGRIQKIDTIFVKSAFHRSLFPDLPDDKFVIAPNGIDAEAFQASGDRDPMLLINTSSADRSLETFLDCFEEIKQQVPEAKAQWAYGWGIWDSDYSARSEMMKWKTHMQRRMQQLGVAELGRISHNEVARLYHRANIFAYPSEMAEIDCISLSKAMAAGAIPITTDFAAMGEKSNHGGVFIHSEKTKDNWTQPGQFHFDMTGPGQKAEFVRAAVNLLRNPPSEQEREPMRQWARATFEWNAVADSWHRALGSAQPPQAALASYDQAIALNPNHAEAHNNRGNALHGLLQDEAALQSFDRAIQLKPGYAEAHCNRANVLLSLKQYQPALESFEQALQLNPAYEYLPGMRLYTRRLLCDWQNSESEVVELEAAIERGEKAALPFTTLAISTSPDIQKKAAQTYFLDKHPDPLAPTPSWPRHNRIRVGYFSSDFYDHATSYLMAEMFERHDRTNFEIIGFSFGPNTADGMSQRVSASMDRFLNVRSTSDRDIAQLSRELEVDIAIDLKGFTHDHRAGIFAHRTAPIQVSFVGYPGTMAAPYIDYLIADPTLIPESSRHHYSEKIAYLPDTYQPNGSYQPVSGNPPTRAEENLPDSAFVFCCFNNAYKITPAVFDSWMRILARTPISVLWLLETNSATAANLRHEAAHRDISPDRLIFARPLPLAEHLARHALADLFLDTSPYNAHTTASDALRAGLPLATRIGDTFAGRVAASLLRAIDLPELITTTEAEYEALAVDLAHDPQRLQSLRQRLQQNRLIAPLFDTPAFTRHLEAAYTAMVDRHHAGLPPDHIHTARTS